MPYEFAMANLSAKVTGLHGVVVHLWQNDGNKVKHGPRIKVSNIIGKWSNDNFSLNLKGNLKAGTIKIGTGELVMIKQWIKQNKDVIERYWSDDDYNTDEMISDIKPFKIFDTE